jgi:hypothetical protein
LKYPCLFRLFKQDLMHKKRIGTHCQTTTLSFITIQGLFNIC